MSKNFYEAPELEVILIETSALLAGSPTKDLDDGDPVPLNPADDSEDDGL